ncbi:MAG: deoxycytidylate deaminase [Planctomycetota bacterium]
MNKRPSKDEYYLGIAEAVSKRSTCSRRKFGAIIVKDDAIVSTGYNGPARGVVNCLEVGCLKDEMDAPEYAAYELCTAVHAEENSIINAARHGVSVMDGVIYIYGEYPKTGKLTEAKPCDRCRRALINSGIKLVVIKKADGRIEKIPTRVWVKEDSVNYLRKLRKSHEEKEPHTMGTDKTEPTRTLIRY